jgi:hypothetical protein
MVGGAGLPWALVDVRGGIPVHEYSVPRGIASADGRAVLVLGIFVMAGTACFTALGSKRLRIGPGTLVVLAAAAGLVIAFPADPSSFAGRSSPLRYRATIHSFLVPAQSTLTPAVASRWRAWGRSWPGARGSWPCSVRARRPSRLQRPGTASRPARAERVPQHHMSRRRPLPI